MNLRIPDFDSGLESGGCDGKCGDSCPRKQAARVQEIFREVFGEDGRVPEGNPAAAMQFLKEVGAAGIEVCEDCSSLIARVQKSVRDFITINLLLPKIWFDKNQN